jgi:hypothetical protein
MVWASIFQVNPGYVRLGQIRKYYGRLCRFMEGKVRLVRVIPGYLTLGQVRLNYVT